MARFDKNVVKQLGQGERRRVLRALVFCLWSNAVFLTRDRALLAETYYQFRVGDPKHSAMH